MAYHNANPKQNADHVRLTPYKYKKLAELVFERDGWQCVDCGTNQKLTLSHIIHRGMGGGNGPGDVESNCVCRCMDCHDEEERNLNGRVKK